MSGTVEHRDGRAAQVRANAIWGACYGFALSGMITVLMAIRSGFALDAVNAHGRSFTDIGAIWLWLGILGGACVGVLRPLLRSALGTAFVGAIAGVLLYATNEFAAKGWAAIQLRSGILIAGLIVGSVVALVLRRQARTDHEPAT